MNDTKHESKQNASHTSEAEALADAILKAAGSGLRHYSMAKTREAILTAAQEWLEAGRAKLLDAARCALADLEGIMPEFEPSGDREHPGWKTIEELQVAITEADDSVGRVV